MPAPSDRVDWSRDYTTPHGHQRVVDDPVAGPSVQHGKRCSGCGEIKSLDNFYMSGGRHVSLCKPCYRVRYSRNRRAARAAAAAPAEGRAFGVELELTGPSSGTILAALRGAGVDVTDVGTYRATNGSQWELKHDGSVRGFGLELVSPKLRGSAGLSELETVCRVLTEVGATVDKSCGVHVHHDMRGLTAEQIKRQVLAFVERQELIMTLVAPSRRHNDFCMTWSAAQAHQLAAFSGSDPRLMQFGPRGAINLYAYPRHGSVEVRCHGGSTNFRKISAWVRFSQALFAAAEAGLDVDGTNATRMLVDLTNSRLGDAALTERETATLLRFVNAEQRLEEMEYEGADA